MRDHPDHVLGCVPEGAEPVRELYTYLLRDYLPARFPTMFSLGPKALTNLATGEVVPLEYPAGEPLEALRRLARTVEDDLLLLQQTPEGHRCVALVCTCASGFDPKEKLGRSLRDIHTPVPSYDKIGPSMERYFSRMEVGKNATRVNWSITDSPALLNLSGNHVNEGDVFEKDIDIDITQARFRCELQTVSRLPETRALLFSFKTYTYPLEDIKLEGLGPDLAAAIEGLGAGNAPGMWKYKGGVRWGKSVCKYLRS
ncbi:hypothetical protein BX600DRAFT_165672 [Xylariales sp. PMI_506]|nr:hypothetical protein BX600DRAFT_165672 [Xylariales sp. PMI_506]